MLTLHLLQYLVDLGLLTGIDVDAFYERMPLDKYGASIYSVGGEALVSNTKSSQLFEIEYRHASDNRAAVDKLEKIAMALRKAHECQLPAVPNVSNRKYTRCHFRDISSVQNIGEDGNGKIIFKITGQVIFNKI